MPEDGLSRRIPPRITRLMALAVLFVGGCSVVLSGKLVLFGDSRGLVLSVLGLLSIWGSLLLDREARRTQPPGASRGLELRSPRVPAFVTRLVGLLVLALGGFLLVACLAHFFSDEPSTWLDLANSPIAILIVWLGLVIDRDRLREEGRKRREHEGLREPDDPKG